MHATTHTTASTAPERAGGAAAWRRAALPEVAFTLVELLVVIGIVGIIAAISVPAIRGLTQSNTLVAAHRQIMDDLALARQMAISQRRTVYLVFVPPTMREQFARIANEPGDMRGGHVRLMTNLVTGQFTAYSLLSRRALGDQPGMRFPRYLLEWRFLPEGVLFDTNKFNDMFVNDQTRAKWRDWKDLYTRPFAYASFPFPAGDAPELRLPYIAFDWRGQLSVDGMESGRWFDRRQAIRLMRGNLFYPRQARGDWAGHLDLRLPPDVVFTARTNTDILIEYTTGRARVERGMQLRDQP